MKTDLNARARLLCLVEIMTMFSDEQNILSASEIIEKLKEYGYNISKRTLLSDIKAVNETALKIISVSKPKKGYYLAKPYSQLAVHLIIEAAYSSDTLSDSDVEYIINYLHKTTCLPLLDQILDTTTNFNYLSPKRDISTDALHSLRLAIKEKKRAVLMVSRLIPGDRFSTAEQLESVVVNPIRIVISSGLASLIFTRAITPKKAEFINLPRIRSAELIDEKSAEFSGDIRSAVNYFDGRKSKASMITTDWVFLRFKSEYIELVENHFSSPVQFRKDENGYLCAKVFAVINSTLVGWLLIHSDKFEIISPSWLKKMFREKLKNPEMG